MRQKPLNSLALQRTINFLIEVEKAIDKKQKINLPELIKHHHVASGTGKALIELKVIGDWGTGHYSWMEKDEKDLVFIARKVKNYLLEKNKKVKHTPINGLEAFTDVMGLFKSELAQIGEEIKQSLRGAKNGQIQHEDARQQKIFDEKEQRQRDRVYLAGCIATGVYSTLSVGASSEYANKFILERADSLLENLYQ